MTVPAWVWEASAAALIAVVVAEIVLTARPGRGSFTTRGAIGWVGVYVSLAAIFGLGVGITASWMTAGQFYAGYLTEYSLSLDNLFIFYVIMGWFAVPATVSIGCCCSVSGWRCCCGRSSSWPGRRP